jgi:hypothetical protein
LAWHPPGQSVDYTVLDDSDCARRIEDSLLSS